MALRTEITCRLVFPSMLATGATALASLFPHVLSGERSKRHARPMGALFFHTPWITHFSSHLLPPPLSGVCWVRCRLLLLFPPLTKYRLQWLHALHTFQPPNECCSIWETPFVSKAYGSKQFSHRVNQGHKSSLAQIVTYCVQDNSYCGNNYLQYLIGSFYQGAPLPLETPLCTQTDLFDITKYDFMILMWNWFHSLSVFLMASFDWLTEVTGVWCQ